MSRKHRVMAISALLCAYASSISGCAKPPPAPQPIVNIGGRACSATLNTASVRNVVFDAKEPTTATLDSSSACWRPEGGKPSVYAAFGVPPANGAEYILSVTSQPLGEGLFAPRVFMLDAKGTKTREIPRGDFVFHGAALYVGIRVHMGEEYLVVASDPDSIGKQVDQISGAVQAYTSGTGTMFFTVHTGSESNTTYTYALNGTVSVAAKPMPKAD